MTSSVKRQRPPHLLAGILALVVLATAGCDTGDGTTLRDPLTGTTLPPLDTTPLPSQPLGDAFDPPVLDDGALDDIVPPEPSGDGFRLFLPWADGGTIDPLFTCDGSNASPTMSWTGYPEGTVEVALSLVDESELSNGRPFVHWVVAGLDPGIGRIDEAALPPGAFQGLNFFGEVGYTGPCPDPATTHTYRFTAYALDQQLEGVDGTPGAELLDLIDTVSIASASATGIAMR